MNPLDVLRDDPVLRSRQLEIAEVLGEGGSAIVYRARDTRHGREVAVKVLREQPAMVGARARFTQEIRVAAGLRHPHILPLFDSGVLSDGRLFSVMPVAQGRPLSALIAEGPLAVTDTVRLAREVAQALAYLHASGYVHRDVKPDNILVESGHAVLTDFGLAESIEVLASPSPASPGEVMPGPETLMSESPAPIGHARLTQAGHGVGTLEYMSPEALFADGAVDGRTDVFSLGVVLFEMLTGALPFGSDSPERLLARRLRDGAPRVKAIRRDVPDELDAIDARCLAFDPSERFASAADLDAALAAVPLVEASGTRRRSRADAGTASVAAVALLVASILASTLWFRARREDALDPRRVVVADLANDTGDSTLGGIGILAGDMISAAITDRTPLTVVNATVALPSRLQRNLPSADSTLARTTRELVISTRAGLAVTGTYFREGDDVDVMAEVVDTRSGRVLGMAGPVRVATAHPAALLRIVSDSVVAILLRRHAPPP